jgi:hypothetical protein
MIKNNKFKKKKKKKKSWLSHHLGRFGESRMAEPPYRELFGHPNGEKNNNKL